MYLSFLLESLDTLTNQLFLPMSLCLLQHKDKSTHKMYAQLIYCLFYAPKPYLKLRTKSNLSAYLNYYFYFELINTLSSIDITSIFIPPAACDNKTILKVRYHYRLLIFND